MLRRTRGPLSISILALSVLFCSTVHAQDAPEEMAVLKLEAFGEFAVDFGFMLSDALKDSVRKSDYTLSSKGGDVTLSDVQLITECEDNTPECLDLVCEFLGTPHIIFGSVNDDAEADLTWHTKGKGTTRTARGFVTTPADSTKLANKIIKGETGSLIVSSGTEPGAEVVVDDVPIGLTPFTGELQVGVHTLQVRKVGFEDSESQTIQVLEGQETKADFELVPLPDADVPMSGMTVVGWILTGVGGACMIGATATGVMVLSEESDLNTKVKPGGGQDIPAAKDIRDSGETLALTTNILWGVGGALAVTGLTLAILGYLGNSDTDTEAAEDAAAQLDFNVLVAPGGAGATLGIRF